MVNLSILQINLYAYFIEYFKNFLNSSAILLLFIYIQYLKKMDLKEFFNKIEQLLTHNF